MTTDSMQLRRAPRAMRRTAVPAGTLLLLLVGACSVERAFCGTGSLSCDAEADYSWVAAAP